MVYKKINILFIVILVFLMSFVCSPGNPNAITTTVTVGLQIFPPEIDFLSQSKTHTLNFHVINVTDGLPAVHPSINCSLHLYNQTGSHILQIPKVPRDSNGIDYDVTILSGNFTNGHYSYIIQCNNTQVGGAYKGFYDVNPLGEDTTIETTSIEIFFITIVFIVFILSALVTYYLPSGNDKTLQGEFLSINLMKYLKPVFFIISYCSLMGVFWFSHNVAITHFLNTTLFSSFFFLLFRGMFMFLPLIIILWLLWIFKTIFEDREVKKIIERGGELYDTMP